MDNTGLNHHVIFMILQKAKEERYWQMRGRPVTPPGGLDIGNYDRQLKENAGAKKREYKEMLDKVWIHVDCVAMMMYCVCSTDFLMEYSPP